MSKAMHMAAGEIARPLARNAWHPVYAATATRTPCHEEFVLLMQCLALAPSSPCIDKYASLVQCLRAHGLPSE